MASNIEKIARMVENPNWLEDAFQNMTAEDIHAYENFSINRDAANRAIDKFFNARNPLYDLLVKKR
ncbi:MAG: hypothetical protein GY853_13190 [PVC group bacterium]|nr:hypothetical protein [PVC group bacterium]